MAVEVKTGLKFEAGIPRALFATRMFGLGAERVFRYAPSADGKRFLINTMAGEEAGSTPFNVVLNWQVGLKK